MNASSGKSFRNRPASQEDAGRFQMHCYAATPSFFCRLVDEVVYWNRSFFSGYT
jgi:hypothetical protein